MWFQQHIHAIIQARRRAPEVMESKAFCSKDLELNEVFDLLSDPCKKNDFMRQAMDDVVVSRDEDGRIMQTIKFKDYIGAKTLLESTESMKEASFYIRDVRQFAIRDDDVFLCTFTKTGTHWFFNLIRFLLHDGPLDELMSAAPSIIDFSCPEASAQLPSPRVVATHRRPHQLPKAVFAKRLKMFVCCRNPKDVAVSMFHLLQNTKLFGPSILTWNCYIDAWCKGLVPLDDYFDYYANWQQEIEENKDLDIIIISFEAMKKDSMVELKRIQAHLGLARSDERLQEIIDKCVIKKLKTEVNEGKVATPFIENGQSVMYRKGIIGDWRNHFTVAQNEVMDELIARRFTANMFADRVLHSPTVPGS